MLQAGEEGWKSALKDLASRGFALLCLVVGAIALAELPGDWREATAANAAPVCSIPSDSDCLIPVSGRVTDSRTDYRGLGRRYLFEPSGSSAEAAWVRFDDDDVGDTPPATSMVLSGATVTALYWNEEPVAFETTRGRVVPIGAGLDSRADMLWVGLVALGLASAGWLYPRNRRLAPNDPRPLWLDATNAVSIGLMLGGIGTIFASRLSTQVIVLVSTVGASAALVALGRLMRVWRSARTGAG